LLDRTVTTNSNGYFAASAHGTAIMPGYSRAFFDVENPPPNYYNAAHDEYRF